MRRLLRRIAHLLYGLSCHEILPFARVPAAIETAKLASTNAHVKLERDTFDDLAAVQLIEELQAAPRREQYQLRERQLGALAVAPHHLQRVARKFDDVSRVEIDAIDELLEEGVNIPAERVCTRA